jgi:hypothetical protein
MKMARSMASCSTVASQALRRSTIPETMVVKRSEKT